MIVKPNMTEHADHCGKIPLVITVPYHYVGKSGFMNSSAFNKQRSFRQISASNPPLRKAAKRYASALGRVNDIGKR